MKKLLLTTMAATMMSTAAIADVNISDYEVGRIHGLMQTANNFENRGINIIENSNKIAVHKTVNAWEEEWDALENENSVDLSTTVIQYTFYLDDENDYAIIVSTDITYHPETRSYTVIDEAGEEITFHRTDIHSTASETISVRPDGAATVEVERPHPAIRVYSISDVHVGRFFQITDGWEVTQMKIERAIQDSYDAGYEDGFTDGYDKGFAAAKSVVKNGD